MVIKKIVLFFPYGYGFNTRAKTQIHKVAFLFFIMIPCIINILFMNSFHINYIIFFLSFTGMYMVYEIGYIYNDTYTVSKEKSPTRWLKTEEQEKITKRFYPILISFRVLYVCLILFILTRLKANNVFLYMILLGILNLFFSFHNFFRGKINILTDGVINMLKYLSPMIIFVTKYSDYRFFIYLFFETAFPRMVEYAIGNGYAFSKWKKIGTDFRRVIYYLLLLCTAGVMYAINREHIWFLFGVIYMLIYRLLCMIIGRNDKIKFLRGMNGDRKSVTKV